MASGGEPGLLYSPNQLGWSPPSSDTGLPADRHLQEVPRASKTPGKPGAGGVLGDLGDAVKSGDTLEEWHRHPWAVPDCPVSLPSRTVTST